MKFGLLLILTALLALTSCDESEENASGNCTHVMAQDDCEAAGCSFLPLLYIAEKIESSCGPFQEIPGAYVCVKGTETLETAEKITFVSESSDNGNAHMLVLNSPFAQIKGYTPCEAGDLSCICPDSMGDPQLCSFTDTEEECMGNGCSHWTPIIGRGAYSNDECVTYTTEPENICLQFEGTGTPVEETTLYMRPTSSGTEVIVLEYNFNEIYSWTTCDATGTTPHCNCPNPDTL